MEDALKQLQQFAAVTDDIGRQELRNRLRRLADSTEDIITTIDRIGHRVRQKRKRIQSPEVLEKLRFRQASRMCCRKSRL